AWEVRIAGLALALRVRGASGRERCQGRCDHEGQVMPHTHQVARARDSITAGLHIARRRGLDRAGASKYSAPMPALRRHAWILTAGLLALSGGCKGELDDEPAADPLEDPWVDGIDSGDESAVAAAPTDPAAP